MAVFDRDLFQDHESVHFFADKETGLNGVIAIHSTNIGPAAGGTRFWTYASSLEACDDALNLSRAMSYKNAMAGIPFGGGKAVLMKPEGAFNRAALFAAYGRAVESLGGKYCTAEDVGVTPEDMRVVRIQTKYVGGLNEGKAASGDPSPVTADGVFRGLRTAANYALGTDGLKGLRVAVQGLGHVGYNLCRLLHGAGASLIIADINSEAVSKAAAEFGAERVDPSLVHCADVDIFAPCALGGAINPQSIDEIRASIVGGAANNQLAIPAMGQALMDRNILYCPDYVINGGGIINVAAELSGAFDPNWVDGKLDELSRTLIQIFKASKLQKMPTSEVADAMAYERIYGSKPDVAA